MANRVEIHSEDPGGILRTITLTQTGADTGNINIESSADLGSPQNFDLKAITADLASLVLQCQVDAFFSADVNVAVQEGRPGLAPSATITISHAVIGNGVFRYPLRVGEDALMHTFLGQAHFPALVLSTG